MLTQLSRYLLKFHQVYIPSVGTLRLVQQPAWLDVANKQLHPPHFSLQFAENGWLTRHQLWYFGTQLHFDDVATRQSLDEAGAQLKQSIEQKPFVWNGIGTFSFNRQRIDFEPLPLQGFLNPVPAERVLRESVKHSVLVGDQVVLSNGAAAVPEAAERHWHWNRIVGWAIVVLSIFFILFYLYQHQFNSMASGLHQRVTTTQSQDSYVQ